MTFDEIKVDLGAVWSKLKDEGHVLAAEVESILEKLHILHAQTPTTTTSAPGAAGTEGAASGGSAGAPVDTAADDQARATAAYAASGAGQGAPSAPAGATAATPGLPPGVNPGTDLAWTSGQHFVIQEASRTFTVEPPAGWASTRDPAQLYAISASENGGVGSPPAWVRFSIGDNVSMDYLLGTEGRWGTTDTTFPEGLTGPFSVTITMLDAAHNPITGSGYGLLVEQTHP